MSSTAPVLQALAKRAVVFLVGLLVASIAIFAICQLLPGDVAGVILGQNADPAAVERLRAKLGLDDPLPQRYLDWVGGMLTGDFGTSQVSRKPVAEQIASKFAVTGWLVLGGMALALLIAVPVGVFAAVWRRRWPGVLASGISQLGLAIPAFWAGIMLAYLFAVRLKLLPANGYVPFTSDPGEWAAHLVLPIVSLALVQSAVLVRYVRSAIIEVLAEDHYRTARAIGWTQFAALMRHGLRNAALSVVTVLGLQLTTLLVGAIVVESVFALPGLGSMLLTAVSQRDLIAVQSTVMVLVFAVLLVNALVDFSYVLIDPRLRSRTEVAP